MVKITSEIVYFTSALLLFVLWLLFDKDLGGLFFGIATFNIIIYMLEKINNQKPFPIEKTRNLGRSFTVAIVGLISTYLISILLKTFLGFSGTSVNSIFQDFAQQSLIFQGSMILTFLSIGILVPINETWLQANILDKLRDWFKIDINNINAKSIFMVISMVAFYVLLHFASKNLSTEALIPVGVFFGVSFFTLRYEGQSLGTMIMHIINNSVAIAIGFSLIGSASLLGPILIAGGILLFVYLLFKTKILVSPISS